MVKIKAGKDIGFNQFETVVSFQQIMIWLNVFDVLAC